MKTIYLVLFLFPIFIFSQSKNCNFDYEEKTDSTFVQILPEKLMYEKVYGNTKEFIQFMLINNNHVPTLNLQFIQKSSDFISANCFNKTSRIVFQLTNGKIVTLLSTTEETCSNLIYNEKEKNNIRILDGYFVFAKENYDDLKKYPISLMRINFANGPMDFVLKREINSEILHQKYYPETFFIDYLECIE